MKNSTDRKNSDGKSKNSNKTTSLVTKARSAKPNQVSCVSLKFLAPEFQKYRNRSRKYCVNKLQIKL